MVLAMEAALAVCIVVASATNCKKDEALHIAASAVTPERVPT
jgi:hypothetical protein